MKKIFMLLIVLYGLLYGFQFAFLKISKGHSVVYELMDNMYKIKVNEEFRSNLKNDSDNYSIMFDIYGDKFYYSIYDNYMGTSKIVNSAKYYLDKEYSCLFVKFNGDNILSDVMCKKDGTFFPFNNIEKPSHALVDFISSLSKEGYLVKDYMENDDESYTLDDLIVHKSNFQEDHYMGLSMNNNLYRIAINKKNEIVKTTKEEVTDNKLERFINNYYVVGNYAYTKEGKLSIDGFKIIDFKSGDEEIVKGERRLSTESYYIGRHENSVYMYDPVDHIEYEVNVKDKTVLEVGNKDTSIKYFKDGEWKRTTFDTFELDNIRFGDTYESDITKEGYEKIYKVGSDYGYYYLLRKDGNQYKVLRSSVNDLDNLTYLFSTTDANSLQFIKNGIYYKMSDKLMYYSDKTGNRTIISSNKLINTPYTFKTTQK